MRKNKNKKLESNQQFLRTDFGIYLILNIQEFEDEYLIRYSNIDNDMCNFFKKDQVQISNNLSDFIDCYVSVYKDRAPQTVAKHLLSEELDIKGNDVYGAVWTKGKKQEPILKTVTEKITDEKNINFLR